MKSILTNVVKGWKTSLIGFIIAGAAIVSVFTSSITWTDASVGIGTGLALMFAPDTILTKLKRDGKV